MAIAARHHLEIPAPQGTLRQPDIHPSAAPAEDFFSTPMPWMLLGVTLVPFLILLAALVAIYVGVEYSAPPWNAHSFPPPRLY